MTRHIRINEKWLGIIILIFSSVVLTGWLFQIPHIINILPGSATMKFNTSLLFFLTAIFIVLRARETQLRFIWVLPSIIIFIAFYSVLENYFPGLPDIDNLVVEDHYSTGSKGRMSPSTAICFMFLGCAMILSLQYLPKFKLLLKALLLSTAILSFISFVSNVLTIPIENKIFFFKTMSLTTSTLLLTISISELLRRPELDFKELIYSDYSGSKIIRTVLPILFILPIALNFYLLYNNRQIQYSKNDFAIVLGSVMLSVISVLIIMLAGFYLNRSERKRARLEQELFKAKQAELRMGLLKETHHRVKNNFQMVSSLLSLQDARAEIPELKSILENCKDRIRTMAAIHENMYINQSYEKIEVRSFFNTIVQTLISNYSEDRHIEIEYNVEPEFLEMEYAIPLSIIINEAVTNSIKHAFKEVENPTITIGLTMEGEKATFRISDNGKGFHFDETSYEMNRAIGIDLIDSFASQINGELQMDTNNGVSYEIAFVYVGKEELVPA